MKVPYDEGLASHIGPESCAGSRKAAGEALTGVRVGQVLSRERGFSLGRRWRQRARKATQGTSLWREVSWPRVVEDPVHAWKLSEREPGDPTSGQERVTARSAQRTLRGHGCDVRAWEVGQAHRYRRSSRTKAGGIPAGGDCGGKGPDQGQSVPTKQVLDAAPAKERS